ncbi:conserved hypothetical protein [Psychromonas ingrahamii 37]|uniref:Cytoskeleton protein RodZ-like C-terminal domain-containing protein n=1 Tax=Psychromonas ingrahamii (strain DSM 17664 / CCUG 51855 / 37) TaxID=357804 RepID=A1SU38_PSYIN|nr:RodZ domain-containing protein [Psychromonas ingrahamii]ABM03003.1 conserved hypothetical protein [Psychromonas ingrahamii 37]
MNNDTPQIVTPLGLALHNARLKASLSVEQVANLLNLKESVVRELEDDISALIESGKYAPIYLRGYLANYAKLVALKSLNEFVEYQQFSKHQARDTSLRATASMAPAGKKRLIPRWLLLALLLVAILAIVFAKQPDLFFAGEAATKVSAESSENIENKPFNPVAINNEGSPALTETTVGAAVDETISEAVVDTTIGEAVVDTTVSEAAVDETIGEAVVDTTVSEAVVDTTVSEAVVGTIVSKAVVDTTISEAAVDKNINETVIESTVNQTSSANKINTENISVKLENNEQLESPPTAISESLYLSFSADCWTEIVDATGERLAFGLYKQDDILSIDGIAPFEIKLGAPSAVVVKYQGKRIEPDFTAGQTLQFSIPE